MGSIFIFGLSQVSAQSESNTNDDEFITEMRAHFGQSFSLDAINNAVTQLRCSNFDSCKDFCSQDSNRELCANWAEQSNLITSVRANRIRRFLNSSERPGQCSTLSECRAYCDENTEECLLFVETQDLMNLRGIQNLRSFTLAENRPTGCTNLNTCRTSCSQTRNADACADFVEENNLATSEQIYAFRAFQVSSNRPGNCQSITSCRSYCANEENTSECIDFAEKFSLSDPSDLAKLRSYLAADEKPGNCTMREECRSYCDKSENATECANFAERHKLEDPIRLAKFRMFHEANDRPRDCDSIDSCRDYCLDSAHSDECNSLVDEIQVDATELVIGEDLAPISIPENRPNIVEEILGGNSILETLADKCSGTVECRDYCIRNQSDQNCIEFAESIRKDIELLQQINGVDRQMLQRQVQDAQEQQGIKIEQPLPDTNPINETPPE